MAKFGKYAADGSVEVEATECAVSGRALFPPFDTTVRERVAGTPYFYRVTANQYEYLTDEMRAALGREVRKDSAPAYSKNKPSAASEAKE
jgi:hypothetical protein